MRQLKSPLLRERNEFLSLKRAQGLKLECLKGWANHLLRFVNDFNLSDGDNSRVSIDAIVNKARLNLTKPSYDRNANKDSCKSKSEEYYIIRSVDFLDYIGLLDERYYNKTLNALVSRKLSKIRLIIAPFFKERMNFIESKKSTGFLKRTLCKCAQCQLHILSFLNISEARNITEQEIHLAAEDYFRQEDPSRHKKAETKWADKYFIGLAKEWLGSMGLYRSAILCKPYDKMIARYISDLKYRGYSSQTINKISITLQGFYKSFPDNEQDKIITIEDVDRYINVITSQHSNRRTLTSIFSIVRKYLCYAQGAGWSMPNLDKLIIAPRLYDGETLPSFMPWSRVQQILSKMEAAKGKSANRNYAIFMLLAHYGMRSGEVATLKISDIDWRKEQITIHRSKSGRTQTLPLLHSVGEAIITYLIEDRPSNHQIKEIFISSYAPIRPMTSKAIYDMVNDVLIEDGVDIKHKGPHAFRHSHATFLINNGQTMKDVGDLLGHRSLESTRIYAKIDFDSLREVSNINFGDLI